MEIRELRYIAEIAKTKHMSTAANNLYISQPALHKTLRKVESELGTELFYKNKSDLIPTDTGKVVLKQAEVIINSIDNMNSDIAAIKNLKQGVVKIGYPSIVGEMFLIDAFVEFSKKYPEILLETYEAGGSALDSMVTNKEIDVAIIMRPIHSETLNEIPLVSDQVAVRVNKTHPFANKPVINMSDLKDVPICTFDSNFNMRHQLDERFIFHQSLPTIELGCASCYFLYQYSVKSNGILILPRPIIEFFSDNEDDVIIPMAPTFKWELSLIFPKNDYVSKANKTMISFLQDYFLQNYSNPNQNFSKNPYIFKK